MSKGGADIMLDLCTHFINENGEKEPITPQKKKDIQ
jgi:Ca2+-transporting ATPase